MALEKISKSLSAAVSRLKFSNPPVAHCYNPLDYAWLPHAQYLRRYGKGKKEIIFVGMNPGPFGMAQTGVPFGDVKMVRDWMGIEEDVSHAKEHPKRPITGFACTRSEVSGTRLWGWAQKRFDDPKQFFKRFFVWNYCPLAFMEESGRNLTPDKLPRAERDKLYAVCDKALAELVAELKPSLVIGVGDFAAKRAEIALEGSAVAIGRIPHPSPANPAANRDWAKLADTALGKLGVSIQREPSK